MRPDYEGYAGKFVDIDAEHYHQRHYSHIPKVLL